MYKGVKYKEIIAAMIKAPSAHNTQPWQFVVRNNGIDVYIDEKRHLAVSDPTYRQLYMSLGCAAANGLVAVAAQGKSGRVIHFPEGEERSKPAVRIVVEDGEADNNLASLAEAINERRTDRNLFDGKRLDEVERSALKTAGRHEVTLIDDEDVKSRIAELTAEGSFKTLARKDFKEELSHWVRNSWTKQPDGMPGYAMGIPAVLSLLSPIMVKVAPIHKQEQTNTGKQMRSASAVAVVVSSGDTSKDWLESGETLELLWLEAVSAGLAAAVEAGDDIRERLQKTLNTQLYPQGILRLGHSKKKDLKATPRRSVKNSLRASK